MKTFKNYQNTLFLATIFFFIISMVHISFALLGIFCFVVPFLQYYIYKEKVWCKYYCPRAGFFTRIIGKISLKRKPPKFLKGKKLQETVVAYFAANLFFVIMSTIMVGLGRIAPIDFVRFLVVFQAPFDLPQLYNIPFPGIVIHLGYRVYSMMFTSLIIGTILGILYMPRTWCMICPVQSLTTKSIRNH